MLLSDLPHELILEIYRWLYDCDSNTQLINDKHLQHSWTLNILSTCMVCQSWYTAGSEYLSMRRCTLPFLSLSTLLYAVETCLTDHPTWSQVLLESQRNRLDFHTYPRRLILNLSPLLNPPSSYLLQRQQQRNHTLVRETEQMSKSIHDLITSCSNLKMVEILYDSRYTTKPKRIHPSTRALNDLSRVLSNALTTTSLSHLIFTAREPIQRCPCCAGRGWDQTLRPLLQQLPITTLELDHVLPSRSVLECLAETRRIDTLIIHGNILTQASRLARYGSSVSTPPRIPLELLSQLRTLEIYLHSNQQQKQHDDDDEDDDDLDLLAMFRQTYDIIHPIPSLQQLILHGREKYNITLHGPPSNDVWRKLELLAERHHLQSFILDNIPGFRCPTVQSRLQHLFLGTDLVDVVYNT
ncbi:hypothetical protein BC941DRAFT_443377 [Chlamydoabsidia padenii]|nr:hypothetical protein BC941DRAFT_443377 [Chlamydoabsidia padenii]